MVCSYKKRVRRRLNNPPVDKILEILELQFPSLLK